MLCLLKPMPHVAHAGGLQSDKWPRQSSVIVLLNNLNAVLFSAMWRILATQNSEYIEDHQKRSRLSIMTLTK